MNNHTKMAFCFTPEFLYTTSRMRGSNLIHTWILETSLFRSFSLAGYAKSIWLPDNPFLMTNPQPLDSVSNDILVSCSSRSASAANIHVKISHFSPSQAIGFVLWYFSLFLWIGKLWNTLSSSVLSSIYKPSLFKSKSVKLAPMCICKSLLSPIMGPASHAALCFM